MSKSILYASNTNNQVISVTTPTVINFGSVVRKYGCNAYLSGGNAVIRGAGYYKIDVNINFTDTAAGTATIQLYKDGTVVSGATSIISVAAADTESFVIPAIIRTTCDCESTITATITGVTGTINPASISVTKL